MKTFTIPIGAILVAILSPFAPAGDSPPPPPLEGLSLAKPDLLRLRQRIDFLLRDEMTRRWFPATIDAQGGFHQNLARDWSRLPDDNRFLVYQARMTWTAAAFARFAPEHRDAFARHALYGVQYLDTVMRDREQGGYHFVLGPDGKIQPGMGTEKHIYGTSFVVYAASAVYEATHDPCALAVARDAYGWLESHAHDPEHGGYFEALTRDGKPILAPTATSRTDRLGIDYGFKTMNSHIHLLEGVAALYKVDPHPKVKARLTELLEIVRDRIATDPGALNLYLTRDWRAIPAHDSFGHDIETAYLLVEAAEILGIPDDPATWRRARQLVDHALDRGWDPKFGGFYDKGDAVGAPAYDLNKVWWTQAEGLNVLLLMHKRFRKQTDRYGKAFLDQWRFIEAHQIDRVHGGWYQDTTREGALIGNGQKASPWKANYHTGRALMNVVTMLDALLNDAPAAHPSPR
ncbi:MAG: AGE family epimerase/isomerase [Isosphaeraceae bacterium]